MKHLDSYIDSWFNKFTESVIDEKIYSNNFPDTELITYCFNQKKANSNIKKYDTASQLTGLEILLDILRNKRIRRSQSKEFNKHHLKDIQSKNFADNQAEYNKWAATYYKDFDKEKYSTVRDYLKQSLENKYKAQQTYKTADKKAAEFSKELDKSYKQFTSGKGGSADDYSISFGIDPGHMLTNRPKWRYGILVNASKLVKDSDTIHLYDEIYPLDHARNMIFKTLHPSNGTYTIEFNNFAQSDPISPQAVEELIEFFSDVIAKRNTRKAKKKAAIVTTDSAKSTEDQVDETGLDTEIVDHEGSKVNSNDNKEEAVKDFNLDSTGDVDVWGYSKSLEDFQDYFLATHNIPKDQTALMQGLLNPQSGRTDSPHKENELRYWVSDPEQEFLTVGDTIEGILLPDDILMHSLWSRSPKALDLDLDQADSIEARDFIATKEIKQIVDTSGLVLLWIRNGKITGVENSNSISPVVSDFIEKFSAK